MNKAETVAVLSLDLDDHHRTAPMKWMLVRQASRGKGESGYCGAGHEDHLILVRSFKSRAIIADDFLVQSCLKSITMNIDQFEELPVAIVVDEVTKSLSFRQTISNEHESFVQEVVIGVAYGRMGVWAYGRMGV